MTAQHNRLTVTIATEKPGVPEVAVENAVQRIQGRSPFILSFLIQEGKNLSDVTFFHLFELVKIEEVSPDQVQAVLPIFLSLLLTSSVPSQVWLQAKRALKRLGEKGST